MKKCISISILIFILLSSFCGVYAEENSELSISDKIESFMLINNPEALTGVSDALDKYLQTTIEAVTESYKSMYQASKAKEAVERLKDDLTLIPENTFLFYPLVTIKYAKQYADNYSFDLLIDESKKMWAVNCKNSFAYHCYYDKDFTEGSRYVNIYDENTIEFLKDPDKIEQMINEEIDEEIVDCKIVILNKPYDYLVVKNDPTSRKTGFYNCGLILYLKGTNTDYGIKIFTLSNRQNDSKYLEDFKIYKMSDILNSCSNYDSAPLTEIAEQKPVYESEITALMEEGLIAGTDKGAEPLKPLSRIEATAMLVRILGLEDAPTEQTSYFSDIASDNWGAKYANIAYENGIAAGVGDNQFAPDDLITSSQFASLLLRSQNVPNDWQTAINVLVDRGIITQEQADKMDLFTRGDMAKIIYECKQKGMI